MGLHKEMTEKVDKLLLSSADDDEDTYAYQSPGHKVLNLIYGNHLAVH